MQVQLLGQAISDRAVRAYPVAGGCRQRSTRLWVKNPSDRRRTRPRRVRRRPLRPSAAAASRRRRRSGRRSASTSDAGRIEAVGSETFAWNTPSSEPPRWTNSSAVSRSPCVNDSSATIVATPTAMPPAVNTVRARLRSRFVVMIASIALRSSSSGRPSAGSVEDCDTPVDQRDRAIRPCPHGRVVADDDHRHTEPVTQAKSRSSTRSEVSSPAPPWARRPAAGAAGWPVRGPPRRAGALRRTARRAGARRGRRARPPPSSSSARRASLGRDHAGPDQRDLHVRPRRQRLQQQMALEDEADHLAARAGGMGLPPDRPPVDQHLPRVGLLETADERSAACSCPNPTAR